MPKRVDSNQPEIVRCLRQIPGMTVKTTHTIGHGFPDIITGYRRRTILWEIKKSEKEALTPDEKVFHAEWKGELYIAWSIEQILEKYGIRI